MVTYAGGLAARLYLGHTRSTGPVTPLLTRHIASATNFSNRYNFLTPFMQIKKNPHRSLSLRYWFILEDVTANSPSLKH